MTAKQRQLPAVCAQPDDGGPIEEACDIVNRNATEAAERIAARRKKLAREAEERDRNIRVMCWALAFILTGAGCVLMFCAPWWAVLATLFAASALYYRAKR